MEHSEKNRNYKELTSIRYDLLNIKYIHWRCKIWKPFILHRNMEIFTSYTISFRYHSERQRALANLTIWTIVQRQRSTSARSTDAAHVQSFLCWKMNIPSSTFNVKPLTGSVNVWYEWIFFKHYKKNNYDNSIYSFYNEDNAQVKDL